MPRSTPSHNPLNKPLTKQQRLDEMIEHLRALTRGGVLFNPFLDPITRIFLSRLCLATNIRIEELERLRKIRKELV
jgi:hypothetical protein